MTSKVFLLTVFVVITAGCSSEPFDYVSASGTVTYEDGSVIPAERIVVTFVPIDAAVAGKAHPPNGVAEVNVADGTFGEVTSHRFGDGILAGRHKVQVVAMDATENPTSAVPREYTSATQSPLEVDTADRPFHLKIRKP